MNEAVIAELLAAIPQSVRGKSGTALYTGLASWTQPSPLYLMGINPGGEPDRDTIYGNAEDMLRDPSRAVFSEYVDGVWATSKGRARPKGQAPMQKRVRHVLGRLVLDPQLVPTSNMVYVRSRQAHHISAAEMNAMANECWPFHARMIERLKVRVVLCMGGDVARFVRDKVGSHTLIDEFVEGYSTRPRKSRVYDGGKVLVVHAAHPSRSPWDQEVADISPLVARALTDPRETG